MPAPITNSKKETQDGSKTSTQETFSSSSFSSSAYYFTSPMSFLFNSTPLSILPGLLDRLLDVSTPNDPSTRARLLGRIRSLTYLLDSQYRVPYIGKRIGASTVMAMVPGAGIGNGILGAWIIYLAKKFDVGYWTVLRMVW